MDIGRFVLVLRGDVDLDLDGYRVIYYKMTFFEALCRSGYPVI